MKTYFFYLFFALLTSSLVAQKGADMLQSGPMVGYVDMREGMLWVQTQAAAEVYATYQATEGDSEHRTETVTTTKGSAFCAHLLLDEIEPGKNYTYKIFINGKEAARPYKLGFKTPPLWQYRTDPPAMKIALGSCTFINETAYDRPGNGYGGTYSIFEKIAQAEPDMMLWLGDNIYQREVDWGSRTGMLKRYTHTRSTPEMQALLANSANYAIWDDHDYGPNNSDRSYIHRSTALEAFKMFWANPTYGIYNEPAAITAFSYGDCDFFLLDNRSFRNPNNRRGLEQRTLLGEKQREWLIDALVASNAKFKFVCIGNQMLNSVERYENHVNLAPEERQYILNAIANEHIKNVIFLSGDRHHSELSEMRKGGVTIYDFTVSPLTSGSYDAEAEQNTYRVKDSQLGERNFGIMEVSGARKERILTLYLYDSEGNEKWKYEIKAQN